MEATADSSLHVAVGETRGFREDSIAEVIHLARWRLARKFLGDSTRRNEVSVLRTLEEFKALPHGARVIYIEVGCEEQPTDDSRAAQHGLCFQDGKLSATELGQLVRSKDVDLELFCWHSVDIAHEATAVLGERGRIVCFSETDERISRQEFRNVMSMRLGAPRVSDSEWKTVFGMMALRGVELPLQRDVYVTSSGARYGAGTLEGFTITIGAGVRTQQLQAKEAEKARAAAQGGDDDGAPIARRTRARRK